MHLLVRCHKTQTIEPIFGAREENDGCQLSSFFCHTFFASMQKGNTIPIQNVWRLINIQVHFQIFIQTVQKCIQKRLDFIRKIFNTFKMYPKTIENVSKYVRNVSKDNRKRIEIRSKCIQMRSKYIQLRSECIQIR